MWKDICTDPGCAGVSVPFDERDPTFGWSKRRSSLLIVVHSHPIHTLSPSPVPPKGHYRTGFGVLLQTEVCSVTVFLESSFEVRKPLPFLFLTQSDTVPT